MTETDEVREISMGNPTIGALHASNGLALPSCNPAVIFSAGEPHAALPREPYVMVAESFSGPLAVMLASQKPALLRAVVLCASFLRAPMGPLTSLLMPFGRLAMKHIRPPRLAVVAGLVGFGGPPGLTDAVCAAVERVNGAVLAHRLEQIGAVDVTALAHDVDVPVLYLRAKEDRLVGLDSLEVIRQSFSKLTERHVAGPHLLLQRHPDKAAAAIEAFCAAVPAG